MTGSTEWITAKDALDLLIRNGHNPADVKSMLAEYLRDGFLHARAEATWVSIDKTLGKAWNTDDVTIDVEREIIVPVRYWRSDIRALEDRARWRWPYNKFFYTITVKPLKRRMIKGVEFSLRDLEILQPKTFLGKAPRRRGRKPEIEKRDLGWLTFLEIALDANFNRQNYQHQADLEKEMLERLKDKDDNANIGENQITEIVRMAFHLVPKAS